MTNTNHPAGYGNQPNYAAPSEDPGRTLGIVGLILAIVTPLIGLIISIVANNQSKKAGYSNGLAKAGIVVGAILTALGIIVAIIYVIIVVAAVNAGLSTEY